MKETDIETARRWYYSGNEVLKESALQQYSKRHLEFLETLDKKYSMEKYRNFCIPDEDYDAVSGFIRLMLVAKELNGDWKPSIDDGGWVLAFLITDRGGIIRIEPRSTIETGWRYVDPYEIHFKSFDTANEAVTILGYNFFRKMMKYKSEYEKETSEKETAVSETRAKSPIERLIEYRDEVRNGWVPDWKDEKQPKYTIKNVKGELSDGTQYTECSMLSFPDEKTRNEFHTDFEPLIRECIDLI